MLHKHYIRLAWFGLLCLLSLTSLAAEPSAIDARPFPRQFTSGGTAFTVYQPQVDSWQAAQLKGRFAMSVKNGTHTEAGGRTVDFRSGLGASRGGGCFRRR